jgi:hypothetical protein
MKITLLSILIALTFNGCAISTVGYLLAVSTGASMMAENFLNIKDGYIAIKEAVSRDLNATDLNRSE